MTHKFFIVGAPRSGTTLCVDLLVQHPEITMLCESHFYDAQSQAETSYSGNWEGKCSYLGGHLKARLSHRILTEQDGERKFGGHFTITEADQIVREFDLLMKNEYQQVGSLTDVLEKFMQCLLKVTNASVWGEKTPNHALYLQSIYRDFPNAKIIFLVRNPLDYLLSYKYQWRQPGATKQLKSLYHPLITSLLWRRAVFSYLQYVSNSLEADRMMIHYEELVSDKRKIVDEICKFLDLPIIQESLMSTKNNSSFSVQRESLSLYEKAVCQIICGGMARTMNYQIKSTSSVVAVFALIISSITLPLFALKRLSILRKKISKNRLNIFRAK